LGARLKSVENPKANFPAALHDEAIKAGQDELTMWRWLRRKIKHVLGGVVNRHPYFWYVAWWLMPRLPFLLPHEKSYYAFRHLARKGDGLFLDVGANNGLSALGFRRLVPYYRIFSVEANGLHTPALEKLKKKLKNFDYAIAAAGDQNSEIVLHTATYNGMVLHTGASVNLEYLKESVENAFPKWVLRKLKFANQVVKVIKLDDLNQKPDLVKTDVEGFEYEVLSGFRETIKSCRPSLLIEFVPQLADKLVPFCAELTYSMYLYDDLNDYFVPFDIVRGRLMVSQPNASPINLFLIPTEKTDGLPLATT
jgi:FkbM family methyltransferase